MLKDFTDKETKIKIYLINILLSLYILFYFYFYIKFYLIIFFFFFFFNKILLNYNKFLRDIFFKFDTNFTFPFDISNSLEQ